ncbi:MAG: PEGA domain-containing protein [Kofleriaceae bacterium]
MSNLRGHRITVSAIAVALWSASSSLAQADPGLLVVGGGAREHERITIGGAIESAVRSAGWSLPTKPATKKEADDLLNCKDATTPWTCVPSSISGKGIRDVLVVSVDMTQAPNGAPLVVITGRMIITEPPEFAFVQRFCEHCADDKLMLAGTELARALIDDLATRAGRTVVHFTSEPTAGDIILDGSKIGATEATYSTAPGKHSAMLQKAGYASQVKEFTVEQGKTAEVSFTLVPSDAAAAAQPSTTPPHTSRSYLLPGIAVGAGTAFALVGGVLLYQGLHESDHYEYPRATAVGLSMELVGLGAIGAGVYLLLRGDANAAPTAAVAPGGAVVGWSGRF